MARQRRKPARPVEWHFFSFPVAFGFVLGMFVATLLYPLGFFVFIVSLFGTSFGVAHILSHWFRRRTLDRRVNRADEEERERRALVARAANAREGAAASSSRKRRRRRT